MMKVHVQQSPTGAHHSGHQPDCCSSATEAPGTESSGGDVGLHHHEALTRTARGAIQRWLLWFLTFFGIYASSSMCPFCGTPGCPVGAGGAALVGGVFAALWQYGKIFWEGFKRVVAGRRR